MLQTIQNADVRGAPSAVQPRAKKAKTGNKRVSRACLLCRQRKSKCELDINGGIPPCQRCKSIKHDCVLGTSNRGGRRIKRSQTSSATLSPPGVQVHGPQLKQLKMSPNTMDNVEPHPFSSTYHEPSHPGQSDQAASMGLDDDNEDDGESETGSITDSAIGAPVSCNPSDSWQCLKHVGKRASEGLKAENAHSSSPMNFGNFAHANSSHVPSIPGYHGGAGLDSYQLVQNGPLSRNMISSLVTRYARFYHPYLPLVPRKYFDPATLDTFASSEKHLLTAVLTVASKDLKNFSHIHDTCARYMVELISQITGGGDCDVEAVEALLIIAEWEPHGLRPDLAEVGRGEEDRAAWMHVALALRAGYSLDLERTSFRGDPAGESESYRRKRLAWVYCYITDRLVSVRNGKGFWSRGPGPMTDLVDHDFPSLKPLVPEEDDYASILQATLQLTQLYGNVHDLLYSGMRTSIQIMLQGDYVKYVDDFRKSIMQWNNRWEPLNCSFHVKMTLRMSYEYLRLYTNAFAFQAAITQASKKESDPQKQKERIRAVFSDVAGMSDSRFIYDSVQAAQLCLDTFNDPNLESYLPYMPLIYYLYGIFAAVFLYKARSFGLLAPKEEKHARHSVAQTMERLERSSQTSRRYARLLDLLWNRKASRRPRQSADISLTALTSPFPEITPAHEFSWLDLPGLNKFIIREATPGDGMLGMDTSSYQDVGSYNIDHQGGEMDWFHDMHGTPINIIF